MTTVYFDLETGGLELHHPIIQLAAVAVDDTGKERGSFMRCVKFDPGACDPEALEKNCYKHHPEMWEKAVSPSRARLAFSQWLGRYKCVTYTSKRTGNDFSVAQLAGYNAATFDMPRLKVFYGDAFMLCDPFCFDVYQLVKWYFRAFRRLRKPATMRLTDVCEYFHIEHEGAHDALHDARATAMLARKLEAILLGEVVDAGHELARLRAPF